MTPIFQIKLRSDLRYIDTLPLSVKTTLLNETKNDWLHWLASSKVLCCSSFALFSCVCSSMIYRVTLSKGWISKDTGTVADRWKTIIFLLMWLFVNWLIRGDCEDDSTLRLESDVSVSVIINKPRVAVEQYFPPCHRERRKQNRACRRKWNQTRLPSVARKLRNRLPRSEQSPSRSLRHLLNITDLIFIVRSENISQQIGNGLYTNRGRMLCLEPRHESVMTEVLTFSPRASLFYSDQKISSW